MAAAMTTSSTRWTNMRQITRLKRPCITMADAKTCATHVENAVHVVIDPK